MTEAMTTQTTAPKRAKAEAWCVWLKAERALEQDVGWPVASGALSKTSLIKQIRIC